MCLHNRAHGLRLDHEIFRTPLDAGVKLDGEPWPEGGADSRTWVVQTGEMRTENDFGVVATGHGFEDSPECERIAGGVNSKGPSAVAIGRQANMLHWGFYCAPDRMTESARSVFLNAIVYMRQFEGEQPLVPKWSMARGWKLQWLETWVAFSPAERAQTDKGLVAYYLKHVPADLSAGEMDAATVRAWWQTNQAYLVARKGGFIEVDADLVGLGVGNQDIALFTALADKLEAAPDDPTALRIAARYLPAEVKATARAIREFHGQNEGHLFFSDVGGYRWFVDPRPAPPTPASGTRR